jgi:hypothetical protein
MPKAAQVHSTSDPQSASIGDWYAFLADCPACEEVAGCLYGNDGLFINWFPKSEKL